MNINLTLIVQMLVFGVLVWFTMKFVWPHDSRGPWRSARARSPQGLAAAEKGEQELAEARGKADAIVREARERANQIIDHAQHRANELLEQAKGAATTESARIVAAAQQQIELDTTRAQREPAARGGRYRGRRRLQTARARDRCAHARGSARQARRADLTH